jgi:enterochelin esterase-like enzyme
MTHYGRLAVRIPAAVLAVTLSGTAGIAVVNDYYGYYQSWAQLSADLRGSYNTYAEPARVRSRVLTKTSGVPTGRLMRMVFAGSRSHIDRGGLVYLPPQYFEAQYAATRFPVIELVHGSPGSPYNYVVHLHVVRVLDKLIAEHLMGPVVLVMPTMNQGRHFEECVNAPRAPDDTYISSDVRADVLDNFRVATDPAQWGIAGYSSGGYCAANLALRHRANLGAPAVMDGYLRPQDGPAATAVHDDPAAELANDPMATASALSPTTSPLPAFWLAAGTGDAGDFVSAAQFAAALHGIEQVGLYREPGAGHNFYAWAAALPHALAWLWAQLAPPDLRTAFPVAGAVQGSDIVVPSSRHTSTPAPSADSTPIGGARTTPPATP